MKIVYATDGSEGARVALDFLLALPLSDRDSVRVVAVPVLRGFAVGVDGAVPHGAIVQTAFEAADELAARACERFTARGVRADAAVGAGLVPTIILEEARQSGAGLIVVGSRGLGALRGVVIGSTARWLAEHSPVPVLVVRERRVAPTRVLIAALTAEEAPAARERIAHLPLPDADPTVVLTGDPGAILEAAGAQGSDLIVVASKRMTAHDGLFVASTAGEVLARAHCAVLIAPAAAATRDELGRQTIRA